MCSRNDRNLHHQTKSLIDHGFVAKSKNGLLQPKNEEPMMNKGKQNRVPLGQISGLPNLANKNPTNFHFQKQETFKIWSENDDVQQDENSRYKNDTQEQMELSSQSLSIDMSSCSQDNSLLFEDAPSVVLKSPHKDKTNRLQEESESIYMTAHSQLASSLGPNEAFYACPEYADDIFKYLRHMEMKFRPRMSYMQKQSEITVQMRSILIDWFIDVMNEYNLHRATLYLTVSILDRTLSCLDCPRLKLQLLGASSVLIAAKYEEIYPPEVKDMVYITDDSYSKDQVIRMEKIILRVLEFNLAAPTSQTFASILIAKIGLSPEASCLVYYLLELSLLHFNMLIHRSSDLAAAAVVLAAVVIDRKRVSCIFPNNYNIKMEYLNAPISDLLRVFHNASTDNLTAIYTKYSESKYFNVTGMNLPVTMPREFLKSY